MSKLDIRKKGEIMILDKKVGTERKQFATQVAVIDEKSLGFIVERFEGNKSLEFYEGLLAGYACSYQIVNTMVPKDHLPIIGGIVAYISEVVEERS